MQRRRNEILNLNEPEKLPDNVESEGNGKRPATSDGTTMPALKKRSLNAKKLKKQKSLGKLGFSKPSISYPMPSATTDTTTIPRPLAAPVYRATTGFTESETDNGMQTRVKSLETELSSLRAKLRWFEESYGEIPADTLAEISTLEPPKKVRRSVFKEELGSLTNRNAGSGDVSVLPRDVKALKGFDECGVIREESDGEEANPTNGIPPESTIKLIPPSPSTKSIVSPPRPTRVSTSPTKCKSPLSSPTRFQSPPSSPSKLQISPMSSPCLSPPSSPAKVSVSPFITPSKPRVSSSPIDLDKSVHLLETLSPIHPNIIPSLVPRQSHSDFSQENFFNKLHDLAD